MTLANGTYIDIPTWLVLLLAIAVTVLGTGRLTRLIVVDVYPPVVWVRGAWVYLTRKRNRDGRDKVTHTPFGPVAEGSWGKLVTCWWCAAPYVAVACLASGWFSSLHWAWWAFWGWLTIAYLASMVIERDEA